MIHIRNNDGSIDSMSSNDPEAFEKLVNSLKDKDGKFIDIIWGPDLELDKTQESE